MEGKGKKFYGRNNSSPHSFSEIFNTEQSSKFNKQSAINENNMPHTI